MVKVKRKISRAFRCAVKFKSGAKCLERVDHSGDLCARHAKTPPSTVVGRFSGIKRQSIRERLSSIQKFERDAMDLLPEIELMRAVLVEFVDNYDELVEALLAWNAGCERGQRPQQIPKLEDVRHLVDGIGRLVARQNDVKNRSSVSVEDFYRVLQQMGAAVAAFVQDSNALKQIELAWGNLSLDAKHPLTAKQKRLNATEIIDVTPEVDGGLDHTA